jgi:hypothetical protein
VALDLSAARAPHPNITSFATLGWDSTNLDSLGLPQLRTPSSFRTQPYAVFATVAAIGARVMCERLSLTSKTFARTSLIPIDSRRGRCSFRKSFA